jgi:CMP-N,N'-diacetyllegionaminic acid synthase
MPYVAFVPARSGSKRVPGKNVKLLAGKPLIIHTLEAYVNADKVDKVILSTDSEEYWELAKSYIKSDKLALDFRSHDQAGDKVKIFDYLKNNHQNIFGNVSDVFLLGLPTVPLRNHQHVNEAISLFEKKKKAIFSATEYGFPIAFAFNLGSDESWSPVSEDTPMLTGNTRSQDQKIAYHPNGAIYIRDVMDLSKPNLLTLYNDALPYLMSREDSVDIDNKVDFLIAEALIHNSNGS